MDVLKIFFQLLSYLITGKPMDFDSGTMGTTMQSDTPAAASGKEKKVDYGNFHANDPRAVDPSVIYAPISNHIYRAKSRKIKYLAMHYTAGASSTTGHAMGVRNQFQTSTRKASADFAVDDGEMVQINPDPLKYVCGSVGDPKDKSGGGATLAGAGNYNTISIEMCSNLKSGANKDATNHSGWFFTKATLDNAANLARILMKKYNIPKSNIVRHYDISGKRCPGLIGWNNGKLKNPDGSETGKMNNSNTWIAFRNSI